MFFLFFKYGKHIGRHKRKNKLGYNKKFDMAINGRTKVNMMSVPSINAIMNAHIHSHLCIRYAFVCVCLYKKVDILLSVEEDIQSKP